MIKQTDWFQTWFNTKYYHILYKNRDYEEARLFIDALVKQLSPKQTDRFLDLACGRGRHSVYLNEKGYNVLGADLSEQSILFAKQSENETLKFLVNDMRNEIEGYRFDIILNLFTSFGYFDEEAEDLKVIQSAYNMLNEGGIMVIDYLNVEQTIDNLVSFEIKKLEGLEFGITKFVEKGFIKKEIAFKDAGTNFKFSEQVKVLYQENFEEMFEKVGFKVLNVFGDYQLNPFDLDKSSRLIFQIQK